MDFQFLGLILAIFSVNGCFCIEANEPLLSEQFIEDAQNAIADQTLQESVRLVEKRVMEFYDQLSKTSQLRFCPNEVLKPCNFGYGRNCSLTHDPESGCLFCDCGNRLNRAQGCAGPYGLGDLDRQLLLDGHKPCPNGQKARAVSRWYRLVDPIQNLDECRVAKQPFCDRNDPWLRMPRTTSECIHFCHSDQDLIAKGLLIPGSGSAHRRDKNNRAAR